MASRYWFARPVRAAITLLYFRWKPVFVLAVPTVAASALGPVLAYDLPVQESLPALLLMVGLIVIAYWQWGQVQRLRARVYDLETELEESTEYEHP